MDDTQVSELQEQDMADLGTLILALASRHPVTAGSRGDSIAFMAQHYSPELHNLAASLVTKPPSVFEVRCRAMCCACSKRRRASRACAVFFCR